MTTYSYLAQIGGQIIVPAGAPAGTLIKITTPVSVSAATMITGAMQGNTDSMASKTTYACASGSMPCVVTATITLDGNHGDMFFQWTPVAGSPPPFGVGPFVGPLTTHVVIPTAMPGTAAGGAPTSGLSTGQKVAIGAGVVVGAAGAAALAGVATGNGPGWLLGMAREGAGHMAAEMSRAAGEARRRIR